MKDIFRNFRFEPNGAVSLKDAVCRFIEEEIASGRIKNGDMLPTIGKISEATGLTYGRARSIVERLDREGYVNARPHIGTVVLPRRENIMRGRVLLALPEYKSFRRLPALFASTVARRISAAGYSLVVATFPPDGGDLAFLENEILRATDLVVAVSASQAVRECIEKSGVNCIFAYGGGSGRGGRPWMRLAPEAALARFAAHCAKAGVKHVTQVRIGENEMLDASPALAKECIAVSWETVPCGSPDGVSFDEAVRLSYKTFAAMPCRRIKDMLLFCNIGIARGAAMALLERGIRMPEDVRAVALSYAGAAPVYVKSFTRFEMDPERDGETVADFALSVLAKGRIPRAPKLSPQYVVGATFPF